MASRSEWSEFIARLRAEQQEIRVEIKLYEPGTMRIHQGPSGGPLQDVTDKYVASLRAEIASKQAAIEVAEREMRNA
jgi:hypothetical protein